MCDQQREPEPQPELSDGVVTLRPWREEDIEPAIAGYDEEIAHWFGYAEVRPSYADHKRAVERWHEGYAAGSRANFVVEHDHAVAGSVEVRDVGHGTGELTWVLYAGHRGHGLATRALRLLTDYAIEVLGMGRVQARVEPDNQRSLRVASRAGLRREGVQRVAPGHGDRDDTREYVVVARLSTDAPVTDAAGFRSLLNSLLPRKRAIAQMLVRDPHDRVLLCRLTYKADWDLPGGVVEVGESPRLAVARELSEELDLDVAAGRLLLTDWLPPWGGWDDAVCLVFDGGVHDPSVLRETVLERREIRDVAFCTREEVRQRCSDFTARRVEAAVARAAAPAPDAAAYTESGRSASGRSATGP